MMIKQRMVRAAMGIALIGASSAATAETTSGWYFGATGGQAQADLNHAEFDFYVESLFAAFGYPVTSGTSTLEDSDSSWSVVAGYRITPHVAVEASFVDFGAGEYRASGIVNPPGPALSMPASYAQDVEASGFTAAAVGTAPIGEMFDVHARAGVMFTDIDISESTSILGNYSFSSDSRDFFYGVGAGVHFGGQWSISLDWQVFKDVGDEDEVREADIDRISLGVTYRL